MAAVKPPNIFVYDGLKDETETFRRFKTLLDNTLDRNSYTVYHLGKGSLRNKPWGQHTRLLVVTAENVEKSCRESILEYLKDPSAMLSVNSDLDQEFVNSKEKSFNDFVLGNGEVLNFAGSRVYEENSSIQLGKSDGDSVIIRDNYTSGGVVISTSVNFNWDERFWEILLREFGLELRKDRTPEMTPLYVFSSLDGDDNVQEVIDCLRKKMENDKTSQVPVITGTPTAFNIDEYWQYLKTEKLGRLLLFTEVIGSTNDTLSSIMCQVLDVGLTIVAGCQISGKGRSGNAWLSPKGSALFSFLCKIHLNSNLGRAIPYVQHIAALAIVIAFQKITGSKKLKVKWPNDIYTDDGRKLGGILVKSSVFQREILCVIGCGVNVCNEKPTVCLNDLIENDKISVETLVASALTEFERLQSIIENNRAEFLKLYYEHWLHSGQKVTLKNGDFEESVEILGLDENGYLRVRNQKGEVRSVQPDGNSLDMMHGLIYAK